MPLVDGQNCPVCNVKMFSDDEDVAFCPVCGTPHHRECYLAQGHCAMEDRHEQMKQEAEQSEVENSTGEQAAAEPSDKKPAAATPPPYLPFGTPPAGNGKSEEADSVEHDRVGCQCPRCQRMCTSDTLFCPYCGLDLNRYGGPRPPQEADGMGGGFPPYLPFGQAVFYSDPLGGVDPAATVDDVPVAEVAGFVANNTRRYLPRFVQMDRSKKRVSANWGAFFLPGSWFFFRKLNRPGLLVALLSLATWVLISPFLLAVTQVPADLKIVNNQQMLELMTDNLTRIQMSTIWLALGGLIAQLLLRVGCLLSADRIYKSHCVRTIKGIKADDELEDPRTELSRRGGVNLFFPMLLPMILYWLNALIMSFIMT